MKKQLRIHLIAAARPNFMKVAPLLHALRRESWCVTQLVHTGQHYDSEMSAAFFEDLSLPQPDFNLGVGSGTHAEQTAGVMLAYEKICMQERPDCVVVVGDVNSTAACALVGAKLWIPLVHLEAGLRSRDRRMPEEVNRLVTDALADLLWTPSVDADQNLLAEGVEPRRIERIGNIMLDSYEMLRSRIEADATHEQLGLNSVAYGVVTLHRPANVDERDVLADLVDCLRDIAKRLRLVFPMHPRTRKRLEEFGLLAALENSPDLTITKPLPYVAFMGIVTRASFVLTDSGGVQEETTYLGIPCLTLRDTTERPITTSEGSNRLVRTADLRAALEDVLNERWPRGRRPDLWDGKAAVRASKSLRRFLHGT